MDNNDLTKGNEIRKIIRFSLPMIFSNWLQQMYSIVDTFIVGRHIGTQAVAAVGSSFTVTVLINSLITGLCLGASIVLSQHYGGKDQKSFLLSVWNSLIFIGTVTIGLLAIAYICLNRMIIWLNTPEEAVGDCVVYLRIIFSGILFISVYNMFSALLRSVGESKVPLRILFLSSVIHYFLVLWFVKYWCLGVRGAAIGTVLSQFFSALFIGIYVFIKKAELIPHENFQINGEIIRRIIRSSAFTSIQLGIQNFGILVIQGLVNSFGVATMASFAVSVKIDTIAYTPALEFSNSYSTFVAQNSGAGLSDRIRKGTKYSFIASIIYCIICAVIIDIFAGPLVALFLGTPDPEVMNISIRYLRIVCSFYFLLGSLFLFYAYFRGIENPGKSIILTVLSLGSRILIAYACASPRGLGLGTDSIWWALPIGWLLGDILGIILIFRSQQLKRGEKI